MSPLAARRPRSIALGLISVVLGAWALAGFVEDRRARDSAADLARRFTLDRRRPLEMAAMGLEGSAGGAAAIAVDAALEDARGQAPPAGTDARLQALWLESARQVGTELDAARDVSLDALRRDPGRAQHRFLLGQVAYRTLSRTGATGAESRRWILPLSLAGSAAPGLDPIFTFLGSGYIESWARLDRQTRSGAPEVWKRALRDPGFASRSVVAIGEAIGRDATLALLPDDAAPLRAAAASFASRGDVATTASLGPRVEQATRRQRDAAIAAIAEKRSAGDLEAARVACQDWVAEFGIGTFDDAAGRAQVARVLALWPGIVGGAWRTDPRGEIVRYFLARQGRDVPRDAMRRATDVLTGVPDTMRARVRLVAGDPGGAEDIRLGSHDTHAFDWTTYLVEAARQRLASGDAAGARTLLREIAPAAAEGCDVLLARRDIAVALADREEVSATNERLSRLRRDSIPAEAWSTGGTMTLCLVDEKAGRLRVSIEAPSSAIVGFGWNGGRQGSLLVARGTTVLTVPVPPMSGRQIFSVSSEAGGPVQPGTVSLIPGT